MFEDASALNGFETSIDDFRAAYLHEPYLGPPLFCTLPKEFEASVSLADPVHKVRKAIYGLRRAGNDYDFGARNKFERLGFEDLRKSCGHSSIAVRALP